MTRLSPGGFREWANGGRAGQGRPAGQSTRRILPGLLTLLFAGVGGIRAAAGLPLAPGLLIEHIHARGPAEAAGLRRGDLAVGSGDRDIRSISCLAEAIQAGVGDVTLRVRRGDQATEVTIPAGCRPAR